MSEEVVSEDGVQADSVDQEIPSSGSAEKSEPKNFMDLPQELRLKVYSNFQFPEVIEHDGAGDMSVRSTRKALLTVCRQVYLEWNPIFYRTARNLVLHRIMPSRKEYEGVKPTNLTAEDIGELFIKRCHDHRQRNITALFYNASMRYRLTSSEVPVPDELVISDLKSLGRSLSFCPRIEPSSLIHIELWETPPDMVYRDDPFSSRHGRVWPTFLNSAEQNRDEESLAKQVWEYASGQMSWEKILGAYSRVEKSWHMEKEVRLTVYRDSHGHYAVVKRVGVNLIMPGPRTYKAKDKADVRITISYSNPDGDLLRQFESPKDCQWARTK